MSNKDQPKKHVIKLDDTTSSPGDQELGTLIVVLLKAKNLRDNHFRKQDVYAQATLNGVTKKTEVEYKGGQHPVWDYEVRLPVMKSTLAKHRKLEIACYAEEPRPIPNELLGTATVDLTETLRTGEFDDWVNLELDGAQRGEMYLEMTYYSNAPAPAKPAYTPPAVAVTAPSNKMLGNLLGNNLQRRPSKLSPADRLSRPGPGPSRLGGQQQGRKTSPNQQQSYTGGTGGPPASLKPSHPGGKASPTGRNDSLPPIPQEAHKDSAPLPSLLRPGAGGGRTPPGSSTPVPIPQQQRPYDHGRHPSASPPQSYYGQPYGGSPPSNNPYIGNGTSGSAPTQGIHPQNPYITSQPSLAQNGSANQGVPSHNPYISSQTPAPPGHWRQDSYGRSGAAVDHGVQGAGGFAFPVPPPRENLSMGGYPPAQQGGYQFSRPPTEREDFDPGRIARYATPLPLPPGAETSRPTPVPVPAPAPQPVAASSYAPMTPPKSTTPAPDVARLNALRRAEEDAKRRHEQELKDLELAMQLDRELNLAG